MNCKNTIRNSNRTRQVEVVRRRHKIILRCEVTDISELIALPRLTGGNINVVFPFYEVICFNFNNGHTFIKLETGDGATLAIRDVTSNKYGWNSGAIYSTITNSNTVKHILKNAFQAEWGDQKIPFTAADLGANELRMITMFAGYDKSFYSAIPFSNGSFEIEESFKSQARKLFSAVNTVKLYNNSTLPQIKSLRKLFFNNMGLFFYLQESEKLWHIIKDPNLFVTLFNQVNIYDILSELHMRPALFAFLEDYIASGSKKKLLKIMRNGWYGLCRYAVNYITMSEHMKRLERKKWKKHEFLHFIGELPSFAIPFSQPAEQIRNCAIDEFEFFALKSSNDYEEAGEALDNCLNSWSSHDDRPVICVKKKGQIVAAIEIKGDSVTQAHTLHNGSISKIPGLVDAYYRWHSKNNLKDEYAPEPEGEERDYCFDDEDALPF